MLFFFRLWTRSFTVRNVVAAKDVSCWVFMEGVDSFTMFRGQVTRS